MTTARLLTTLALLAATAAAHAGLPFEHPALAARAQSEGPYAGVIIGHPASPQWQVVHANGTHPAVLVSARAAAIDPNTYRVQPPATTQWTLHSAADTQIALAR